jgi:hypothetical protein
MNEFNYIKSKQQNWAKRKGFVLSGGTIPDKGEKNYLENIDCNLFESLTQETKNEYESGNGNETKDNKKYLAKMKALHSSSAIVVNLFQYWKDKDVYPILYACNLCKKHPSNIDGQQKTSANKIKFEQKFKISSTFSPQPNIDVVIDNLQPHIYAIESKFTEPYNGKHNGISKKYIDETSLWNGLSNLKALAGEISPANKKFEYLDAAQLIKHILGLTKTKTKKNFHLLYLWYDVIGENDAKHRKEIEQFADIVKKDKITFRHITYQEVIMRLSTEFYKGNERYCDYLTERYL